MLRFIVLAIWLAAVTLPAEAQTSELRLLVTEPHRTAALVEAGLDVAFLPGETRVYANEPWEWSVLRRAEVPFEVLHADLEAFYGSRLWQGSRAQSNPPVGQGGMGGYYTLGEVIQAMDSLQQQYPYLVAPKVSLGQSHEGRDIWMWKISDNPLAEEMEPEFFLDAGHHGREPITVSSAIWFAQQLCEGHANDLELTRLVNEREIFIVPVVNPDGYAFNEQQNPGGGGMWRKNRRLNPDGSFGVDPNRNYDYNWGFNNVGSSPSMSSDTYRGPSPFSEPCTVAVKNFCQARGLSVGLTLHAFGGYVFIPQNYTWGATPLGALQPGYEKFADEMNRLPPAYRADYLWWILPFPSNGTYQDWLQGALSPSQPGTVWAFGMELGSPSDGFWPAASRILPVCRDAFHYQKHLLRIAGSDPRLSDISYDEPGGNSPLAWEPGETIEVFATVENGGVLPDAFTVEAISSDSSTMILNGPVGVGTIASLGGISSTTVPIQISIDPNAVAGQLISFEIVARSPAGANARMTITRPIGVEENLLRSNSFETGTLGWTVGFPGDTATTNAQGQWTQGDPVGTTWSGHTFNPETDHTAAPGTDCWFTGQGAPGGPPAAADVDGVTSLLSPVFDATHIQRPQISFWVWYAGVSMEDGLAIHLSNDGGASWTLIDTVRGLRDGWAQQQYLVEDHLPRTSAMQLRFTAYDIGNLDTVEAAIDDFQVSAFEPTLDLTATTPPMVGASSTLELLAPQHPGRLYFVGAALGATSGIPTALGPVPLDLDPLYWLVPQLPAVFQDFAGTLDAGGQAVATLSIPAQPALTGLDFFLAAVIADPQNILGISGGVRLTVQ